MRDAESCEDVKRAQRGDMKAFDRLVRRYQDAAVGYARTLLPDVHLAEDAAQAAFVQAWRELPALREPGAFGGWLRRIVWKFCDRVRRSTRTHRPLEDARLIADESCLAKAVVREDEAAHLRVAINALPGTLREVTWLYYLTGHDIREIAAFLEVPPQTIKNRLHAARKRLRKELWTMAEMMFTDEKPSQDGRFQENVLARLLREFQHQETADPHTADRGLLDQGRSELLALMEGDVPLDFETVKDAMLLLWRLWDFPTLARVLTRFLAQDRPDSETAWAYLKLANALAIPESAPGAVLAHEAFERWLPGKTPRLSTNWPYLPVTEGGYDAQEIALLFLSQSGEFAASYAQVWRRQEYLRKADHLLASIPLSTANCRLHFYGLRMANSVCMTAGDLDRAREYVGRMETLAEQIDDPARRFELRAKALEHGMELARLRGDTDDWMAQVQESTRLLEQWEQQFPTDTGWIRGERHNLACEMVRTGEYGLALPIWETMKAKGQHVNGWGWLMHAAAVWRVTGDRPRTLALMREARAHEDEDLTGSFLQAPAFQDVQEDAEFLAALRRA